LTAIHPQSIQSQQAPMASYADQRADTRVRTVLQSARLIGEGRQTLCVVRDISERGMKVRLFGEIAKGERVCVELKGGHTVLAKVVWVADGFAGLELEQRIDVDNIFGTAEPDFSYRSPRLEVDATVTVNFGRTHAIMTIIDISVSGMKLMGGDTLIRGEQLSVEIEGLGKIDAKVRWKASDLVGIEFESPLSVAKLADWAKQREFRRSVADMVDR